jgi:mRNA interferase RelE/StbE
VKYEILLSRRAQKDLDGLGRDTRERMLQRLDRIAEAPHDPRLSGPLKGKGELRKSRVGGWRIIFSVEDGIKVVAVVAIEPRGQVYRRI